MHKLASCDMVEKSFLTYFKAAQSSAGTISRWQPHGALMVTRLVDRASACHFQSLPSLEAVLTQMIFRSGAGWSSYSIPNSSGTSKHETVTDSTLAFSFSLANARSCLDVLARAM